MNQRENVSTPYHEVQHAVLQNEIVSALNGVSVLQRRVVDAGVCQASGKVGAGQRLTWHLRDGNGVTQFLYVLCEEICVAHIKGSHGCVKCSHGDGGDLGTN